MHPPCVSSRKHHRAHYSAHGHMQRRAYMRALVDVDVYIRNLHSQTDGITLTDAMTHETHTNTHTHTCADTITQSLLHTHIHTWTHTLRAHILFQ